MTWIFPLFPVPLLIPVFSIIVTLQYFLYPFKSHISKNFFLFYIFSILPGRDGDSSLWFGLESLFVMTRDLTWTREKSDLTRDLVIQTRDLKLFWPGTWFKMTWVLLVKSLCIYCLVLSVKLLYINRLIFPWQTAPIGHDWDRWITTSVALETVVKTCGTLIALSYLILEPTQLVMNRTRDLTCDPTEMTWNLPLKTRDLTCDLTIKTRDLARKTRDLKKVTCRHVCCPGATCPSPIQVLVLVFSIWCARLV